MKIPRPRIGKRRSGSAATVATASDASEASADSTADDETPTPEGDDPAEGQDARSPESKPSTLRLAVTAGVLIVTMLAGLTGWLGVRAYQSRTDANTRALLLHTARQAALNLTTIDYTRAEADIQRIVDSATGAFKDDFQRRSQPFVQVVKQSQSKSVGTITEAGLEAVQGDQARALVAVSVKTTSTDPIDEPPRAWRMRIVVQKLGTTAKVSNVEFVP